MLREHGHDAVHVCELGLRAAEDEVIFERAAMEDRVLLSADTDFGTLLALRCEAKPSVVLFRRGVDRRPLQQAVLLLSNLPVLDADLRRGCVAIFDESRLRVRTLPIAGLD